MMAKQKGLIKTIADDEDVEYFSEDSDVEIEVSFAKFLFIFI